MQAHRDIAIVLNKEVKLLSESIPVEVRMSEQDIEHQQSSSHGQLGSSAVDKAVVKEAFC